MLKTRSGVVHEEICGEHLLVATQAARPFCRHWALQLNDAGYFIWKLLEEAPSRERPYSWPSASTTPPPHSRPPKPLDSFWNKC